MVVLDTHAAVWWSTGAGRLGRKARAAIEEADSIGIPAIVFWEVALLVRGGRLELTIPPRAWSEAVLSIPRVRELPLVAAVAVTADVLEMHADPADRFIVATAQHVGAPLVTKDRLLRRLPFVTTVW